MVSEVKWTLKGHDIKRQWLPSDEMGRQQPQGKLAPFQTTHQAHVFKPLKSRQEAKTIVIFLFGSDRRGEISTIHEQTSPTRKETSCKTYHIVCVIWNSRKFPSKPCIRQIQIPQPYWRAIGIRRKIHHGTMYTSPGLRLQGFQWNDQTPNCI